MKWPQWLVDQRVARANARAAHYANAYKNLARYASQAKATLAGVSHNDALHEMEGTPERTRLLSYRQRADHAHDALRLGLMMDEWDSRV